MPIAKRPVNGLTDVNQLRRDRETLNQVLDHTFDDSRVQTPFEIAAGITPINKAYPPGDIRRYGAVGDGVADDTQALQHACDQAVEGGAAVLIPWASAYYRITSAISLSTGIRIYSDGTQPDVRFFGCDGFVIASGAANLNISGLQLFSLSSGGAVDPKTNSAISIGGASGSLCNYMFCRDLYLRGWDFCIYAAYTWNSTFNNITTINCNVGILFFGQSVNNFISDSRLICNTGTASVMTLKDGAVTGEGLEISNSLLAQGTYGIRSDGFLLLLVNTCVLDLIGSVGLELTNVKSFSISDCWVYAQDYGVHLIDLGVPVEVKSAISDCHLFAVAANGKGIRVGSNVYGTTISGGSIEGGPSGTARCIFLESGSSDVSISGVYLVNPGTNPSVYAGGSRLAYSGLLGDATVQMITFPTVASAAALDLPMGRVIKVTGTTNITSISNIYEPERVVTLIFADALTFTDGSNLRLAGNFVTTADDTITLACDETGLWYEVSRSVN